MTTLAIRSMRITIAGISDTTETQLATPTKQRHKTLKAAPRGGFRNVAAIEQHSQCDNRGRNVTEDIVTQRNLATQRQIRLTNSQITDLIDHYNSGVSVVLLAKKYGVHKSTVSAHLHRAGVEIRGSQRSLTSCQVTEAASLYSRGSTLAELAARFNVSSSTIRASLARAEVPIRAPGRRSR